MDNLRAKGVVPSYDDGHAFCGTCEEGTSSFLSLKERIGIDFYSKPKLLYPSFYFESLPKLPDFSSKAHSALATDPDALRKASREALSAIKDARYHLSEIKTLGFKVPLYASSSDCLSSLRELRNLHIILDREPHFPGDDRALRDIQILQRLPKLKRLEVELRQPLTQDEVGLLSNLKHLEELIIVESRSDIALDNATTLTVDQIDGLPELKVFHYESNGALVDIQIRNLSQFEQLDTVSIGCSSLTDDAINQLVQIKHLDYLSLKCTKPVKSLKTLRLAKNLRVLDLDGVGPRAIESLDLPQLIQLRVTPHDLVCVRPENLKLPLNCEVIYDTRSNNTYVDHNWLQRAYPGRKIINVQVDYGQPYSYQGSTQVR